MVPDLEGVVMLRSPRPPGSEKRSGRSGDYDRTMAVAQETSVQAKRLTELAGRADDTPDVVVDLGVVRANIERAAAAARAAGVAVRPHVKTHKLPQVARLQVDAGAVGLQVAKLGEAEVMAAAGIADILVAYPIVGASKLRRLGDLAERCTVSVALDSVEVGRGIAATATARGIEIRLLIELDTGMHRLGVEPGEAAADLAERLSALPGVRVAGVFAHEGHVYTQARDDAERERMTRASCLIAVETAAAIRDRGIDAPVVSVGSAGTFRFAIHVPGVTEVRPGTYVFNDRSQLAQGAATEADLAAVIATTIVSRPDPGRVVVDAGSKVLTSDRMIVPDPPVSFGAVAGHEDWHLVRLSEEHGVIEVPPDAEAAVGDRLAVVPNHVCPAVNLANEVTVVEDGAVVGRWPVAARGLVR